MAKKLRQVFVDNLKYYRQKKGFSQLQLAIEIEKSVNYINGIENNNTFPSPETIEQIATVLGIQAKQLFDEEGCPENILSYNKNKFIEEITENLAIRFKADIKKEIREVFDSKKS